jgi:hypothetical protein
MILSDEKSIKTIRITNKTYQTLVSLGKYTDSMDEIINRVLSEVQNPLDEETIEN